MIPSFQRNCAKKGTGLKIIFDLKPLKMRRLNAIGRRGGIPLFWPGIRTKKGRRIKAHTPVDSKRGDITFWIVRY